MGATSDIIIDENKNFKSISIDKDSRNKKLDIGNQISDFEFAKILGKGSFGEVSLVKSKKTKKYYAMNKLIISTDKEIINTEKEIKLLESLNHQNLINYYTSFKENGNYYIVIEYMNGKTLEDIINDNIKNNFFFGEKIIWELLIQCLNGLFYLHVTKKIIHKDIKPDNLILDKDNNIKISDFGVSVIDSNDVDDIFKISNHIGPIQYLAPEILQNKIFDFKNDLFTCLA